jgi:hypothetical protein
VEGGVERGVEGGAEGDIRGEGWRGGERERDYDAYQIGWCCVPVLPAAPPPEASDLSGAAR